MRNENPPRLAAWLLTRMTDSPIAGDYEEIFHEIKRDRGTRAARSWYRTQVLRSIPMFIANIIFGGAAMIKNHIKLAWRNILRQKRYAFLNITGLAVGLAVCLLMAGYVFHELNFENMHPDKERVYRINGRIPLGGRTLLNACVGAPLGPAARESIPEIDTSIRLLRRHNIPVQIGDLEFKEKKMFIAEQGILQVFAIPLHLGNPETALEAPFTVVIDENLSRKYFRGGNPLGKTIRIMFDQTYDFTITGVMRNLPSNTVLRTPMIVSFATLLQTRPEAMTQWDSWGSITTFLRLHQGVKPENVNKKITSLARSYLPDEDRGASYYLQPLDRIYLDNAAHGMNNDLDNSGSLSRLYTFSAVALLILIIAAINFINLSTAKISGRMKEVGIRKTCGAVRSHLIKQFLIESLLLTTIAMGTGLLLFSLFKPRLDHFLGKTLNLGILATPWLLPLLAAIVLLVAFLAGSYPAVFLSRFPAAVIFRARIPRGVSKSGIRRVLVGIQFFIAAALIICTLIVLKQVRFSQGKDLGYNQDNLIVLQNPEASHLKNADTVKRRLLNNSGALGAAVVDSFPSAQNRNLSQIRIEGKAEDILVQSLEVDPDFVPVMKLRLAAGRNFETDRAADADALLINKAAVRLLGFDEPLGKLVRRDNQNFRIIGVLEDWNTNSIHSPIHPTLLFPADTSATELLVRLPQENPRESISRIRDIWGMLLPGQIFDYAFIEDLLLRSYDEEQRLASLLVYFCGLTILVACLGIFGLAAHNTEQRTKEIGSRKVLGSSVSGILLLLTRSYGGWVLTANLIAWPAAYTIANRWLRAFSYRTDIGFEPFLLAGLTTLLVALLSVIFQTLKAALADPVRSLRYE